MSQKQSSQSYLQHVRSWLLLPLAAYVVAIPFLGGAALFVPMVILNAPIGIIGCFDPVGMDGWKYRTEIAVIHACFWTLMTVGIVGCRSMPVWALRIIWWILVAALVMSVRGCAVHLGPGLRNPGNWH